MWEKLGICSDVIKCVCLTGQKDTEDTELFNTSKIYCTVWYQCPSETLYIHVFYPLSEIERWYDDLWLKDASNQLEQNNDPVVWVNNLKRSPWNSPKYRL